MVVAEVVKPAPPKATQVKGSCDLHDLMTGLGGGIPGKRSARHFSRKVKTAGKTDTQKVWSLEGQDGQEWALFANTGKTWGGGPPAPLGAPVTQLCTIKFFPSLHLFFSFFLFKLLALEKGGRGMREEDYGKTILFSAGSSPRPVAANCRSFSALTNWLGGVHARFGPKCSGADISRQGSH